MEKLTQFAEAMGATLEIEPRRVKITIGDRHNAIRSAHDLTDAEYAGMVPLFRGWVNETT